MHSDSILFSIFLIFSGAALLATVALYMRQAMLVAYLVLGAMLGPWGAGLVTDAQLIQDIARIGIIFLLFLLGLNLAPQKLFQLIKETTLVTLFGTLAFGGVASIVAWGFGFALADVVIVGVAASFSSTIIGLKLLPTTVLHHRHTGEVIISVLLLQDLIAIIAMLVIQGYGQGALPLADIARLFLALPALGVIAWLGHRYVVLKLFLKFDRIQEYVFLLTIGWCLGIAQLAEVMGLSYEIGAFVAGVAIATSPIALHIASSFKPLRDFFLVLFFFGLGAGFDLVAAADVVIPATVIAILLLIIKPVVFRFLLVKQAESNALAWETGVRLGQLSEFSLLIVFVARQNGLIALETLYLVQLATIITFIISAYWIVAKYPTPIALNDELRRD
ncbi:cation:proton antiporter [Candidatus Spongiihabitans sp.]|uniref:cation:proton antiporter domain-containing protein n=1 Tax=Candidatus Spongiihabitans sp. TaxID=3101308 RepID=UPI003C7A7501